MFSWLRQRKKLKHKPNLVRGSKSFLFLMVLPKKQQGMLTTFSALAFKKLQVIFLVGA